ncbi:choice-of-anchor M domain-containing protein [Lentzea sp. BCCO 10_0798]|uniref:Choice-of-anchor M domain-containing protein n=1 Tax=Lentzea kristufekii TaxID=3095430 RepID=A0ABU4TQI2_9PSEU|nr:choice-of-anchor M domain-containing protein [Lentzea sp. BCCO 10_0798]MDX8050540.1 choice-of-anchor M domain-containing protein [Lentzea sp. BCCO 10_0798]
MHVRASTRVTAGLFAVVAALLTSAPAALAEPAEPVDPVADAVLDVAGDRLEIDAAEQRVEAADPAAPVELTWDTTSIEPGTVFGDRVTLRASVVDSGTPAGEPVAVPVASTGTLQVDPPGPGGHELRLQATAHALDGRPLAVESVYALSVAEAVRPEVAPQVLPAAPRPEVVAPSPQIRAVVQQPPTATGRVVIDRGHVDAVAPRLLPDGLHIQVKDGTVAGTTTWREPADVELKVTSGSRTALPSSPELAFLGAAGEQVFLLPQTQRADLLWAGWSTEELRPADVTGPVTWSLTAVEGPGAFGLFTTGSFGEPTVLFNSTDGLPDAQSVPLGTHAHANWVFAEPGRYRLTFTATAPGTGGPLTDTETYTFTIGDGTPSPVQPGTVNRKPATALASTGPAGLPAVTGLGLALLASGVAVLVITRRRVQEKTS